LIGTPVFATSVPAIGSDVMQTVPLHDAMPMFKAIRSVFSNLTNVNGTLFFMASDPASGTELWKSDGTEVGTVLVKDIRPGPDSSDPSNLTNANGTLFFTASDPASGRELWKSDIGRASGRVSTIERGGVGR